MITEPQTDKASVLEDRKLRDSIESFEKMFLDYRYPEVEDGETTSEAEGFIGTSETPSTTTQSSPY